MLGTLVNVGAIIFGTLLGIILDIRAQQRYTKTVMRILGVVTLVLGAQMVMGLRGLVPVISIVIGGTLGHVLHLSANINSIIAKFSRSDNLAGRGFVTATVLFCVGPMAIIGSLEDGLRGNPSILFTKSGLDGVASVVLGATFGTGVIFSALSVLALQGSITALSSYSSSFFTEPVIADLTSTGGVIILTIALNMLGFERLKAENLLPSLLAVGIISAVLLPTLA